MTMNKGERDELRRLVRQRSKVLRDEVKARTAELAADVEQKLVARFYERDEKRMAAEGAIRAIITEANEKIDEVLQGVDHQMTGVGRAMIDQPYIRWDVTDRLALRHAALKDIEARAAAAVLSLSRQEVDLLEQLARGALESEEAMAFLASIPSVGELVPAARMDELEAALEATPTTYRPWEL
jgi:hypothetical protein